MFSSSESNVPGTRCAPLRQPLPLLRPWLQRWSNPYVCLNFRTFLSFTTFVPGLCQFSLFIIARTVSHKWWPLAPCQFWAPVLVSVPLVWAEQTKDSGSWCWCQDCRRQGCSGGGDNQIMSQLAGCHQSHSHPSSSHSQDTARSETMKCSLLLLLLTLSITV